MERTMAKTDEKNASVSIARNDAANKEKTTPVRVWSTSNSQGNLRDSVHSCEGKRGNKSVGASLNLRERNERGWPTVGVFSCGRLVNRRIFFFFFLIVCTFNSVLGRLCSARSKNLNNNFSRIYCISWLCEIFLRDGKHFRVLNDCCANSKETEVQKIKAFCNFINFLNEYKSSASCVQ